MERLIVIVGPTAVGKTKVSIDLALKMNSEIISGDSMLVYRGCDIGTAKPDMAERRGIIHHLIDILEPDEEFTVVEFQKLAGQLISAINRKGKIPILAGGTGLYVKALLEGYQFNAAAGNKAYRNHLTDLAEQKGNDYLHTLLAKVDPAAAGRLHPNDQRRVMRALEVHHLSGENISQNKEPRLLYDVTAIGLTLDRARLYERINQRVDMMIANGLVAEVKTLLAQGISPCDQAMKGIGYKEIVQHLKGEVDLPTAVYNIKLATRHFAKRQLTWYRKMPYINWVPADQFSEYDEMMEYIYSHVAGNLYLK